MDEALNIPRFTKGQLVEVSHLQGTEVGEFESINFKTGRVTVFFNYEACPHFDTFLIEQVKPIKPKLVEEEDGLRDEIKRLTPQEKSKMADRIYNHIVKLLDEKISDHSN